MSEDFEFSEECDKVGGEVIRSEEGLMYCSIDDPDNSIELVQKIKEQEDFVVDENVKVVE